MNAYDSVRGFSLAAPSTAPCPGSTPFSATYVEELLTPRLLSSPIPDVSQLVGCLLCDAVRIHHEQLQLQQRQHQHRQRRHSGDSTLTYASSGSSGSTNYTQPVDGLETAGAESLPFPRERCADVLHCICTCFARLPSSPMNASPSSAAHQRPSLQRVAYLIERAAAAHIFRHLLPHCSLASEETQQALRWVFEAVRCASSAPAGELGNRGSVGTPTSTATCGEMAQVLRDIICCTSVVTPAHLVPLLDELVVASPTLRLMSLSASSSSSFSACAPSARQNRHLPAHCGSSGALITTRLLLEQMDMLQPAIATWAMGEFEEGLAEVLASKARQSEDEDLEGEERRHGSDTDEDEPHQQRRQQPRMRTAKAPQEAQLIHKRRGLQVMAHVLEVLVALIELHVDLAEQLLPALAPHLEHTCPEVRLLLLRGLSAAFAANEAAVRSYRAAFMGPLLNRFLDVKPNIRMEAVRLSTMLLQRFGNHARPGADRDDRHAIGLSTNLSRMQSLQQDLWKAFQPCWERLLADPHVLVRRQAVASVTEAALAAPLLLQPTPHSESIDNRDLRGGQQATPSLTRSPSNFLAQTLGLRALDKNRRVRCAAVDGLTRLYSEYRLVWIPNAVLDAVRIDAGSSLSSTAPATLTAETVVEGLLPAPFSCLSPTSATCAAAATQATLTQWLSPTSPAALPLTKTPALLDFERNALEEKQLSQQHPPGGDEFDEGDALLGFGASASSTKAVTGGGVLTTTSIPSTASAAAAVSAYVDALVQLCQHVDSAHFAQLLRLSEKKPQLRLAIRRLFEFHAAVKESNGDVKSAEGQQRIHSIHRLLTFLQETTGARKGEWDALFRAKDETVRRALLRACDAAHTDWVEVRKGLLRSLHGRISADEFAFVKQTLMPQMVFAVKPAHLAGLMQRLHRSIYTSARNEVVVDGAGAAGALRALLLLTAASPSFAALSTEGLVEALQAAAKQSVGPPPNWCGLLLQALQRWATATATMADRNTTATTAATSALHDSLIATLRAMALASLPMQQTIPSSLASTAFARDNDSCRDGTAFSAVKQLAKQATRTLVALLRVPGYNTSAAAALHSLASELAKRLASGRALINDVKTVAWLASVQALARCGGGSGSDDRTSRAAGAALLLLSTASSTAAATTETDAGPLPALLLSLSSLLVAAVEDVCGKAGQSRLKALATASAAAANTTAAATMPACGARSSSPVSTNMPVTAAIVDGSAKAMVALVLSCPKSSDAGGSSTGVASRANSVICAVDALLKGYKASVAVASGRRGPASIGSCHCRIALQKQLVKLLLTPTPDIGRELAVSVVLSVEESAHVRHAVQAKLAGHLLHRTCDMRVAALLLLTAISEDSKSSYHRLRGLVETVGDHLRAKQVSQGASLSSPSALYCYWEYTIPFLVLFLAHHPYYASEEAENQFVGFQRVWHLLIGELLRHGTQCAGFVVELLSKIKQSDDALAPGSDACRVMCDLASRVLLECLGQRQSRAEDLRRYPGAVLLPSFFVRTSRSNPQKLLETVFLDQGVRVTANAPFRMPTVSGGAAGAGSGSRGSSLQATPRASSTALSRGADGATDINHVSSSAAPYGVTTAAAAAVPPSPLRKRARSPSTEVSAAVSLSPPVRPQCEDEVAEGDEGSMPQRECTEPAVGESANNSDPLSDSAIASQEWNAKRAALQRLTVEEALDDLFCGLTKTAIAQLRWKVVRSRIEEALRALDCSRLPQQPQPRITNEGTGADLMVTKGASLLECDMENLLQYAKDQLRVRYDRAPA
ncbi:conserved hypothetical protein [Leishmania infantum JPCM5]|uniref:Uncharacterized protein n=3 Tax=Leishmania donovani species complex TaxID=38574 RepID=A4HUZ5_LEIIN|nr:conserved hypothetical protein [Leishmania infantum JPCM5]CAC9461011.1 hypothetical_protein_-_conserved [Leishmania infantum]CAM66258.1 conserved hypothetical protein [Leishmania infantum JPCM5]SUZ39866.1 hypothetical_protein_-_conserved [Leishmania infantum]VDZ42804.1 hypothetical_protein_conserved [Leishmania donovani]|eukprot:XP_001463886.1 conserved hypothetical protein [Leishmania infantum JPCM5]